MINALVAGLVGLSNRLLVANDERAISARIVREVILHNSFSNGTVTRNWELQRRTQMANNEGTKAPCSPYLFIQLLTQLKLHNLNIQHIEIGNHLTERYGGLLCNGRTEDDLNCTNLWQLNSDELTLGHDPLWYSTTSNPMLGRSRSLSSCKIEYVTLRWLDLIYLQIAQRQQNGECRSLPNETNDDNDHYRYQFRYVATTPKSILIEALQLLAKECPNLKGLCLTEIQGNTLTNAAFIDGLTRFDSLRNLTLEVDNVILACLLCAKHSAVTMESSVKLPGQLLTVCMVVYGWCLRWLPQGAHGSIVGITDTNVHDIVEIQRSARTNNGLVRTLQAHMGQPRSTQDNTSAASIGTSALSYFVTTSGCFLHTLTLTGAWIDRVCFTLHAGPGHARQAHFILQRYCCRTRYDVSPPDVGTSNDFSCRFSDW